MICLSTGCNSRTGDPESASAESVVDTLPTDFVAFYKRFHVDSAYQLDHIVFPLEGLPNSLGDGDTLSSNRYFWQKETWNKHNPFTDPGGDFEQWFEVYDTAFIEHWVQMKGTNMTMRRRFAKMSDGWYMIYYQGMRPVSREMDQ